ncbi:MAG: sialate O-acetylesterase [Pirellula sp.]|nr:sialate O-acetylesterase [Pirellula sp.]
MKNFLPTAGLLAALFVHAPSSAQAEVRLPAIFSEHMVVQAEKPVAVWGWAAASEAVVVSLAGQEKSTTAAADGTWRVTLDSLRATQAPQTLTVRGRNTLTVNDVLVGEVWLCSGQSNMAMQMKGLHGAVDNADAEIAAADHPQLRMFVHDALYSIYELASPPREPLVDRPGKWLVCSPTTAAQFSAIAYYFGRDIQRELSVPVGMINSAVGGTPIEAWTSLEAQTAQRELKPVLDDWQTRTKDFDPAAAQQAFEQAKKEWLQRRAEAVKQKQPAPKAPAAFKNLDVMRPAGLFNGMIAPLMPYTVRGVLWYQGERNAAGPLSKFYGAQLRTLINDWRTRWSDPALYFAYVQLPRFAREQKLPSEPEAWGVVVREEMRKAAAIPHTGMAVTIDLGGVTDGHPTNKADYARRLSLLALHDVYGKSDTVARGPLFRSAQRDGASMVLTFDHAEGLRTASGALTAFAVAGDDHKFHWAEARIVDGNVVVTSPNVPQPAAVRYGWASNPKCNLINGAGLPASPFRTDDWEAEKQ